MMLLYDADCPLCVWYTGAFVKWGWMSPSERVAWDQMPEVAAEVVDADRSRHEIALFDASTGRVWYGVDSLLAILGRKMPLIERIGHLPLVHGGLKLFYQLITYNRKIIAGKAAADCKGTCNPDFHAGWRVAYILLAFVASLSLLMGWFGFFHSPEMLWGWGLAVAIFVATPVLLMLRLPRRRSWDVAGHAATVGLIVGLAVWPVQGLLSLLQAGEGVALGLALAGGAMGAKLLWGRVRPLVH